MLLITHYLAIVRRTSCRTLANLSRKASQSKQRKSRFVAAQIKPFAVTKKEKRRDSITRSGSSSSTRQPSTKKRSTRSRMTLSRSILQSTPSSKTTKTTAALIGYSTTRRRLIRWTSARNATLRWSNWSRQKKSKRRSSNTKLSLSRARLDFPSLPRSMEIFWPSLWITPPSLRWRLTRMDRQWTKNSTSPSRKPTSTRTAKRPIAICNSSLTTKLKRMV